MVQRHPFRGLKALYEVDKNDTYVKAMIDNADYAWQYTRDENGLLNNDWSGNRKDKFKSLLENSCMIDCTRKSANSNIDLPQRTRSCSLLLNKSAYLKEDFLSCSPCTLWSNSQQTCTNQ